MNLPITFTCMQKKEKKKKAIVFGQDRTYFHQASGKFKGNHLLQKFFFLVFSL